LANLLSHSISVGYKDDAGTVSSTVHTYSDDSEYNEDMLAAAGATNKEYDVAFTLSKLISLVLFSDQAVTIKTNSSSAPQDTINLQAGKEVIWTTDGAAGGANPFAGNVTKFFITNAGVKDANVKFRALAHLGV
jgi:hypothetical protein